MYHSFFFGPLEGPCKSGRETSGEEHGPLPAPEGKSARGWIMRRHPETDPAFSQQGHTTNLIAALDFLLPFPHSVPARPGWACVSPPMSHPADSQEVLSKRRRQALGPWPAAGARCWPSMPGACTPLDSAPTPSPPGHVPPLSGFLSQLPCFSGLHSGFTSCKDRPRGPGPRAALWPVSASSR